MNLNLKPGLKFFLIFFIQIILITLFLSDACYAQEGGGRRMLTYGEFLLYPRVWVSVLFGIAGGLLLMFVKIKTPLRLLLLAVMFLVFAVLPVFHGVTFFAKLAPHPSPMCAITKPVIFSLRMNQFVFPAAFAGVLSFIVFLSIIGNKLFCGWVCPIGALQEFFHLLPFNQKKFKPRFSIINSIRAVLLIGFVPLLLAFGFVVYSYFNPFELLHWPFGTDFSIIYVWAVAAVTVLLSLFIFRPFCQIACPIGIITWILEKVSLTKIRLNKEKCNSCMACVKKSPCLAIDAVIEEKPIRPDCYACGKCIDECPTNALSFKF